MKKITEKCLLLFIIFLFSLSGKNIAASNFVGFGTGAGVSKTSSGDGNEKSLHIPVIIEYEYGIEYRDLWLFNAAVNYLSAKNDTETGNIVLFSAGIKYVPRFYFFRSNITESTFKKNSCLGILLLPFTVIRDAMNNITQYGLPSHPFIFLDYTLIKTEEKIYSTGFSTGAGITSGLIDVKFKYTQNLKYDEKFHRDIYLAAVEFTLHVPLQEKFLREKPLVE